MIFKGEFRMKKSILILFLIMTLTFAFVGCETKKVSQEKDRNDTTEITEATNASQEKDRSETTKDTETTTAKENSTKIPLINYLGRWHLNGDFTVGENEYDRELEITDINKNNVTFDLSFFRITGIYDVSAKIEGNIAKFYQAPIGGTLEFYNNGVLVSIDKSELEYIKTGKLDFNSKDRTMKQEFKHKLDMIQAELDAERKRVDKEGDTDSGILTYAENTYDQWDTALNKIYGVLKQSLSVSDMKQLQTEELKWISQKEKEAKDAESEQGQGSQLGNVVFYSTSAKLTKDRCYQLVEKYME